LKERIDVLLVEKGFIKSREKAKATIMAGLVFVDNQKVDKAGDMVDVNANIFVKGDACPYVSRGGLKLEKAMNSFVPEDYYELEALFQSNAGEFYKGILINKDAAEGKSFAFKDRSILESISNSLSIDGVITDRKEEEKTKYAPSLFNMSDLQKECANKFGMIPEYTLKVAQSLYDHHYLSYPRTDSKHLTAGMVSEIPDVLESVKSIPELSAIIDSILADTKSLNKVCKSKKYFDDAKVSDHPALTPTNTKPDLSTLSSDEVKVYTTVVKRLVAIFLPPQISLVTTLITTVNGYDFKSTGTIIKQQGWKELYDSDKKDTILPNVQNNDSVNVTEQRLLEKKTTPPARYTDATIIDAMETAGKTLDDKELEKVLMSCAGLGTTATRAEILKKLEEYGYVDTKRNKSNQPRKLIPTQEGTELIEALSGRNIASPELTAQWEKKLKDVENGTCSFDVFYKAMISFVKSETVELSKLEKLGRVIHVIGKCPKCGRDFIEGNNAFYCQGFTEKEGDSDDSPRRCMVVFPKKVGRSILKKNDAIDLITKRETREREFTWSSGEKSKTKMILDKDFQLAFPSKEAIGYCPKCNGRVFYGKNGYYCENVRKDEQGNSKCDFSIYKQYGKTPIKPQWMKELLKNFVTKKEVKITYNSGKVFTGVLKFTPEFKLTVEKLPYDEQEVCSCPYCSDGIVMEKKKIYSCTNKDNGCNFWIFKSNGNTNMSSSEVKTMLHGGDVTKEVTWKDKSKHIVTMTIAYDQDKQCYIYKYINTNNS